MTGIGFAVLGLAALAVASGYHGATAVFPMALGGIMAALGAALAGRALLAGPGGTRRLVDSPRAFLVALVATAGYVAAVPHAGFFTASIALMLALPVALGLRRPVLVVLATALFVALVWAVFTLVLEKPLPREFFEA